MIIEQRLDELRSEFLRLRTALEAIVSLPKTDGEDTAAGHWFRALDIARTALKD